jgi:hypothetical protein
MFNALPICARIASQRLHQNFSESKFKTLKFQALPSLVLPVECFQGLVTLKLETWEGARHLRGFGLEDVPLMVLRLPTFNWDL